MFRTISANAVTLATAIRDAEPVSAALKTCETATSRFMTRALYNTYGCVCYL